MVFYKIEATIDDVEHIVNFSERRPLSDVASDLSENSETYYQKSKQQNYVFVVSTRGEKITLGMICRGNSNKEKVLEVYQKCLPFALKDISFDEVTFKAIYSMLNSAVRNDFIYDSDDVLDVFGISDIVGRYGHISYGEAVIDENVSAQKLFETADSNLFAETFRPELERIYEENSCKSFKGHPVHYIIRCDDKAIRRNIHQTLLAALYANKRIQNKRYCFVDYDNESRVPGHSFESLYKSCEGGAIIIRYGSEYNDDSQYAKRDEEVISALCEIALRYKNKVLTIICLPRVCDKSKELFLSNFGLTSFVEIFEDVVGTDKAKLYLKNKAKENKIRSDKNLLDFSDESKYYTVTELNKRFDEWYDKKLRNTVYPQYKKTHTTKAVLKKTQPRGSAYEDLQGLIGLGEAKKVMAQALDFYKAQKLFADKGYVDNHPAMHMVFTGNPGTAKTTVARLFAQVMKENGLLSNGNVLEVGRADIVGKYVGSTAPLVKNAFKNAKGGVLFIDEAYSLVDDRDGLFGDEAINTIVQEMENNREDTIVIFAGYPDKMEGFLSKNPGLRSRIAFNIPFADYSEEELVQIAELTAQKSKMHFTDEAKEKMKAMFSQSKKSVDFGNGRFVRNVFERAKMQQASRLVKMNYEDVTEEILSTLTAADIVISETKPDVVTHKIGF